MRHSARARAQVAFVCAALLAATPATAVASSNPVHVDPKSPVAKEYAIPLATARGAAPESGQTGALFGSGISSSSHTSAASSEPATSSAQPETTSTPTATPPTTVTGTDKILTVTLPDLTHTSPASSAVTKRHRSSPSGNGAASVQAAPSAYRVLRAGSGSGIEWMIVAAVVVIALGSAGGFLLSRKR
jgi:hypothetical protein